MDAARRNKRYPSEQPLLVRCESWNAFVELYAGDIGQGGMFIITDDPPPILSVIDIRMQLPEAMEIALRGRVVHVVEKEQVINDAMRPGVGIEFVELDAERKQQIFHLIEFARWQGATGDPNASLARTMLELQQGKPSKMPPRASDPSPSARPAKDEVRRATLDGEKPKVEARKTTLDGMPKVDTRKTTLDGEKPLTSSMSQKRPISQPLGDAAAKAAGDAAITSEKPASQAKPSDPAKVKIVMTHFAHKRFDIAIKEAAKMLEENPGDTQALKWQWMCKARLAIAARDDAAATQHYEKALEYDEGNREARDFVRNHHRDKRLNAIPFGRYFTTKKK